MNDQTSAVEISRQSDSTCRMKTNWVFKKYFLFIISTSLSSSSPSPSSTSSSLPSAPRQRRRYRHSLMHRQIRHKVIVIGCFFINRNLFQNCMQPFGHEMLSWVRLRGINSHNVTPSRYIASWHQFINTILTWENIPTQAALPTFIWKLMVSCLHLASRRHGPPW